MLISLEGLPGAGKSTQGRMLAEHLQRKGTKTCYLPDLETQVAATSPPTPSWPAPSALTSWPPKSSPRWRPGTP
ncbi:MAG: hypothetical protein E6J41_08290 [Chloroflexi bacterium]|nr:MAG: hypothetical protein E6J41_08290 [Chloroflexota bacterium]